MRAPLQSRNDIVNIAPFSLNIETPISDTTTGWDDLQSGSGGVISIVRTDPKLVPTHKVGVSVVGSKQNDRLIDGNITRRFTYQIV